VAFPFLFFSPPLLVASAIWISLRHLHAILFPFSSPFLRSKALRVKGLDGGPRIPARTFFPSLFYRSVEISKKWAPPVGHPRGCPAFFFPFFFQSEFEHQVVNGGQRILAAALGAFPPPFALC